MKIFVHKVRTNPIDGWGQSIGIQEEILGYYPTKEKAIESKEKRDLSLENCHCDIGNSWIEEVK